MTRAERALQVARRAENLRGRRLGRLNRECVRLRLEIWKLCASDNADRYDLAASVANNLRWYQEQIDNLMR
jgi:hypothetical protein